MHCFDERLQLSGEYDSVKARHLVITFEKCDPKQRKTCKNETEINEWIRDKYLVTIENSWTFRTYEYKERKLNAQSKFYWFKLSSQFRQEAARRFTVSEIEFQDQFWQFGASTKEDATFFRVDHHTYRPYESDDRVQFMIRYEMNRSIQKVDRAIYGTFDWLGDIGGFNEALGWVGALVLYLFQFHTVNRFIVKNLYTFKRQDGKKRVKDRIDEEDVLDD